VLEDPLERAKIDCELLTHNGMFFIREEK